MAVDVKKVIAILSIPIIVVMPMSEPAVEVAMDMADVAVAPISIIVLVMDISIFADVV